MSNFNRNGITTGKTRFTKAPVAPVDFSRFTDVFKHITTFNAGDIVPIAAMEVLPNDTFDLSLDSVVRQNTILTPTMGEMILDVYAFFVPNRVINESWKNVQGENTSGRWVAPEVSLAPLVAKDLFSSSDVISIPVGCLADFYGYPTQAPISLTLLEQCHDLLFRGYLEIYNNFFRDQNYQAPVPYSKLNIHNDFFGVTTPSLSISSVNNSDGAIGANAITKAVYGEGVKGFRSLSIDYPLPGVSSVDSSDSPYSSIGFALRPPFKANKLHDYFTSVLPSPQKGPEVTFNISGVLPVDIETTDTSTMYGGTAPFVYKVSSLTNLQSGGALGYSISNEASKEVRALFSSVAVGTPTSGSSIIGDNLKRTVDLANSVGVSINELRTSAAVQQVYETLARGGSRYIEYISSMFGLETDNPFKDIPTELGHSRITLDLYQTAQTSASAEGSTPQGNLSAFGYTSKGGHLFTHTFLEHGYVHVLAVVRHRNIYASTLSRDKFRLNALDFYQPPLANISEQPVFTREINPFSKNADGAFGYQEAWAEYRYEPDRVSGYMRTGIDGSLALWNYADDFSSSLNIAESSWLKSNSQEVLDRSLAVTSAVAPQFKGQFRFTVTKQRPMPTYSLPGMDII